MEEVRDRIFKDGEQVQTDGRSFTNCRFEWAQLRYGGGVHPTFQQCVFDKAGWYFEDAALRTVQLIQALGNGENGRPFIDDLFRPGYYIGE
jgi:hypothetical protein